MDRWHPERNSDAVRSYRGGRDGDARDNRAGRGYVQRDYRNDRDRDGRDYGNDQDHRGGGRDREDAPRYYDASRHREEERYRDERSRDKRPFRDMHPEQCSDAQWPRGKPSAELEAMRHELREAENRLQQLRAEVDREEREEEESDERWEAAKVQRESKSAQGKGGLSGDFDSAAAKPPPPPKPLVPLGNFSLLLVKHSASETVPQNRSLEAALQRLRKVREKILSPSDFNIKQPPKPKEVLKRFTDAARLQSDCPTSARKGGELGQVMPGMLPPELEREARGLNVGNVSREVRSVEGCGILLRTA